MADDIFACVCGFKCVESQIAKTEGACPKCGKRSANMKAKYGSAVEETTLHMKFKGGQ